MRTSSLSEKIFIALSLFISLLMLIDFLLPGTLKTEIVNKVSIQRSSGARSGRSEPTVKIVTPSCSFYAVNFESVASGDTVAVEISPLLNIVKRYQLPGAMNHYKTNSLRTFSSLWVPILNLLICATFILVRNTSYTWIPFYVGLIGSLVNLILTLVL